MSRVCVVQPTGEAFYDGAVADVFEDGTLTISNDESAITAGAPVETIRPGLWTSATVYDDRGYVFYALRAPNHQEKE